MQCQWVKNAFEPIEMLTELMFLSTGLQLYGMNCAAQLAGVASTVVMDRPGRE